jgi:ligand-binding sensor domain-containing protein
MTGVKSLLEDSTGNIWIGTQGSGLLKFDREHGSFVAYRHDLANPESLADYLFFDKLP